MLNNYTLTKKTSDKKRKKNTRHHDVTFNFLTLFQLKPNSSTPHSKKHPARAWVLSCKPVGLELGMLRFSRCPIHGDDMFFSLGKKMVWLVVSMIFYVHPYLGKMNPSWRAYFSDGLVQPPTSGPLFSCRLLFSWNTWNESIYIYISFDSQLNIFLEPIIFSKLPVMKGTGRISTSVSPPEIHVTFRLGWRYRVQPLRPGEQHWAWSKPHVTWLLEKIPLRIPK